MVKTNFVSDKQVDLQQSTVIHEAGYYVQSGLGIRSTVSERIGRFLQKNEQMSDSLNKTSDSLIRSFLVSDLSNLLTSLTKNEGMSRSLFFLNKKTYKKHTIK